MEAAIFIFYLLLFCFLINVIPFFKNSGLGKKWLILLFLIKIGAGIAYAKFYSLPKYREGADTWRFHKLSLEEKEWLLSDPIAFCKDLFNYGYSSAGGLFSGENSYWNDLKSNVIIKMMAIINVLTNSSYYTNIIVFNFLFFFGLVALYRFMILLFPQKRLYIIAGIFLLPSTLFWCSGIHKDGLILSALGLIIYCFYKVINERFSFVHVLVILLSSLMIFTLRNYIFFALLPALFCWAVTVKFKLKPIPVFLIFYFVGMVMFFASPIFSNINPMEIVASKQHEFLQLDGGSSVINRPLTPTFIGFISYFPTAADMAFLRPHITEAGNISYIPAVAEVIALIIIMVICVFSISSFKTRPEILFLFFLSISVLLICGYTIPITGAIVRYRSIVLPLLITPLLCLADLKLLRKKKFR